jgi:hypothetical protein
MLLHPLKGDYKMTMKNPPHPGDLIRTEIIEALGLSVSKAAGILKVRRAPIGSSRGQGFSIP